MSGVKLSTFVPLSVILPPPTHKNDYNNIYTHQRHCPLETDCLGQNILMFRWSWCTGCWSILTQINSSFDYKYIKNDTGWVGDRQINAKCISIFINLHHENKHSNFFYRRRIPRTLIYKKDILIVTFFLPPWVHHLCWTGSLWTRGRMWLNMTWFAHLSSEWQILYTLSHTLLI